MSKVKTLKQDEEKEIMKIFEEVKKRCDYLEKKLSIKEEIIKDLKKAYLRFGEAEDKIFQTLDTVVIRLPDEVDKKELEVQIKKYKKIIDISNTEVIIDFDRVYEVLKELHII